MNKTKRLYYETHALETQAMVKDLGHDDHGHYVILDQTVAHPKGGGARSDRGSVGTVTFNEVVADGRDGDLRHYFDDGEPPFAVGHVVEVKVDPEWRLLQAKYHSAGHLLAAVAEEQFPGIRAVGGHHFAGEARIEFEPRPMPFGDGYIPLPTDLNDVKTKLDAALKDAIERNLPIQILDPYQNRQVQVGSYPPVGCGGVHCKTTGELGRVEIKSVKVKDRKLRLSYQVGHTNNQKGD